MIRFEAAIEDVMRGGAVVVIPDDVIVELGGPGRIPVLATFDGIEYQGSVVNMGGRPILGVLKSIREELGKGDGDTVIVTLERDVGERKVSIPPELDKAFESNPQARRAFEKLSYSHQREHVNHINEGKKPETRVRRAFRVVDSLRG